MIYIHIPKAGGRTLIDIVYRQYWSVRARIFKTKGCFEGSQWQDGTEASLPAEQPFVVLGHLYYGLHERLPWPCVYATMLRDPVERTLSQYYYFRRVEKHPFHEAAMSLSLEAFLESGTTTFVDNVQTRFLSGDGNTPYGECNEEMLQKALCNLERFEVVGLVERFDASLLLLQEVFQWRDPYYLPVNVNASRPRADDLSERALRLLRDYNSFDLELYRVACRLFERQVGRSGLDFDDRLIQFKRSNAERSHIMRRKQLMWQAKQLWSRNARRARRALERLPFFSTGA